MFQGDCCRQHSVESRQPQATGWWPLQKPLNAFSGSRGSHPQFSSEPENYEDQNWMDTLCEKFSSLNDQVRDCIFQSRSWQLWPMGLAACLFFFFFNNLRAKDGVYIFKWSKTLTEEEHFMIWKQYEIQISVSMSKSFIEHSHVELPIAYGCFPTTRAEQLWQRQHGPQSLKYLFSGPLQNQFSNFCFRTQKLKVTI